MKDKYLVFDLDDTLIYEVDYLQSAYRAIAQKVDISNSSRLYRKMWLDYQNKEDVFENIVNDYPNLNKEILLNDYRNHYPSITLNEGAGEVLHWAMGFGYKLGIITDGRSITQRNKLKATQIEGFFDKIIISEEFGTAKPDEKNYSVFVEEGINSYYYIADNPKKDFVIPNRLGWTTICLLDKGHNIHPQSFACDKELLPKFKVSSLLELKEIIK